MTNETKTCPFCGEEILAVAKKCKHCGEWIDKQGEEKSETVQCPACGEEVLAGSKTCNHCGENLQNNSSNNEITTSTELPSEAKKYNWGPLFTGFIWGFFNGMPKNILITLVVLFMCSFIPTLGIVASLVNTCILIWAGTKGNQWAWCHKNWNTVEEFNKHQKKWVLYPFIIYLILTVLTIVVVANSI